LRPTAPTDVLQLTAADIALFDLSYINQEILETDGVDFKFSLSYYPA